MISQLKWWKPVGLSECRTVRQEVFVDKVPEFIWLEGELTKDDLRRMLAELAGVPVKEFSKSVILTLAGLEPAERLRRSISKVSRVLSKHCVNDQLVDGILPVEREILLELEELGVSENTRASVHKLLGLKERWIFTKCMSSMFTRARRSDAFFEE